MVKYFIPTTPGDIRNLVALTTGPTDSSAEHFLAELIAINGRRPPPASRSDAPIGNHSENTINKAKISVQPRCELSDINFPFARTARLFHFNDNSAVVGYESGENSTAFLPVPLHIDPAGLDRIYRDTLQFEVETWCNSMENFPPLHISPNCDFMDDSACIPTWAAHTLLSANDRQHFDEWGSVALAALCGRLINAGPVNSASMTISSRAVDRQGAPGDLSIGIHIFPRETQYQNEKIIDGVVADMMSAFSSDVFPVRPERQVSVKPSKALFANVLCNNPPSSAHAAMQAIAEWEALKSSKNQQANQ